MMRERFAANHEQSPAIIGLCPIPSREWGLLIPKSGYDDYGRGYFPSAAKMICPACVAAEHNLICSCCSTLNESAMTTTVSTASLPELQQSAPARRKWALLFPIILTVLYIAAASPVVWAHPLWRDEVQAWVMARDSATPWALVHNMRYDGHPVLWHMLLWLVSRVTVNPAAMQWTHLALAASSVYVLARYSPLTWAAKILFAFSYYAFFEYGIVARNYQVGMLLMLIFCALWQHRRTSFLTQSVVLALLCHANVFAELVAFGLFTLMFYEMCLTRAGWYTWRRHYFRCVAAILIFAAMAWFSILCMNPPADYSFAVGWNFDLNKHHIERTLNCIWNGIMTVPQDVSNFWNSNALRDDFRGQSMYTGVAWCVGILLGLLIFSPRAALVFVIGFTGVITFLHVKYPGATRHQGTLFLVFLCSSWIALAPRSRRPWLIGKIWRWGLHVAIIALLCIHVWGNVIAVKQIRRNTWSNSANAAACIKEKMQQGDLFVGERDMIAEAIFAYLPGEKYYSIRTQSWQTFNVFDNLDHRKAPYRVAREIADEQQKNVIVILAGDKRRTPRESEKLGSFGDSITGDDYTIYRIKPRVQATRPATQAATQSATQTVK